MKAAWFSRKYLVYLRTIVWEFYYDKLYLIFALAALLASIIWILNHFFYPSNFWDQFTTEKGISVWFCENTDMKKLIRQPINSFTNIWYMLNAIFFLSKGIGDVKRKRSFNLVTANPYYSFLLGIISIYTFCCSLFFHSSLISFASRLDFSAVYSISLFPLMYFSHRMLLLSRNKPTNAKHPKETTMIIIIFSLIYLGLTLFLPGHLTHSVVLCFIILTGIFGYYLERKYPNKTNRAYLLAMVIYISLAVLFFKMDIEKIACDPDSFLQPHSLWHICNSIAVFYLYLYIRSENYLPEKDEKLLPFKKRLL